MRSLSATKLSSSFCAGRRRVTPIGRQAIIAKFQSSEEAVTRAAASRRRLEERKLPPEAAATQVEIFPSWIEITIISQELAKLASKEDLAKLASKEELKEELAKLAGTVATKEELAKLASKEEVAKLASKGWSNISTMAFGTVLGAAIMYVLGKVK